MSPQTAAKRSLSAVPIGRGGTGIHQGISATEDIRRHMREREERALKEATIAELEKGTEADKLESTRIRKERENLEQGKTAPKAPADGKGEDDEIKIWYVDSISYKIRPAQTGETPLTIGQAREAQQVMMTGEEAPMVIYDAETHQYVPNPDSRAAKKEPMLATAMANQYNRTVSNGQQPDALEIFLTMNDKVGKLKETLGVGGGGGNGVIAQLKDLQDLGFIPKPGTSDPAMVEALDGIRELLSNRGPDPEVTELKAQVTRLNEQLEQEKDLRNEADKRALREQIDGLQAQISSLGHNLTGRTEMDFLGDIGHNIHEGFNGMRSDIKTVLLERRQPKMLEAGKDKATMTANIAEAAERNKRIVEVGDRIFLNRQHPPARPPEQAPAPSEGAQ